MAIAKTASHAAAPTRACTKCGKTHPLTQFASNSRWSSNSHRDAWCLDCAKRMSSKEDVQHYFWDNHRQWSERLWEHCIAKAREELAGNTTYQRGNAERRAKLEEAAAARRVPSVMNLKAYYAYAPSEPIPFERALEAGKFDVVKEGEPDSSASAATTKIPPPKARVRTYSAKFNGSFTEQELAYLNNFYDNLGGDDLDDFALQEYVKKFAKASLAYDKAQDDYNNARCGIDVVKDAMSQFDTLAKSSNLAACQRKKNEIRQRNSWSEWTKGLLEKEIYAPHIEWPKDDIDKTLEEYQHIIAAIKGDPFDEREDGDDE